MDNSKLGNYLLFLSVIQEKINKFFYNQRAYIFCKQGCSKCCRQSQFPYTEIEFRLLVEGMKILKQDELSLIMEKIDAIIQAKNEHLKNNPEQIFEYDCPFLRDDSCIIYPFRGLVCRCFGLMSHNPEGDKNLKIPFCAYEGLNYSNVLDLETGSISKEKYQALGIENEPTAFNASYASLIDKEFARGFDFEFGEVRPMIEWFEKFGDEKKTE